MALEISGAHFPPNSAHSMTQARSVMKGAPSSGLVLKLLLVALVRSTCRAITSAPPTPIPTN